MVRCTQVVTHAQQLWFQSLPVLLQAFPQALRNLGQVLAMAERASSQRASGEEVNRVPPGVIRQAEAVASNQTEATRSAQFTAGSGPENRRDFSALQEKRGNAATRESNA